MTLRIYSYLALYFLAIASASHAQVVTALTFPKTASPPNNSASVTPFSKLLPDDQQLTLRGLTNRLSIPLPISNRTLVQNAKIHVEFTSSILLLDATSQVRLIVNDNALATVPIHHLQPTGQLDAVVPDNLIRPGYNDIEVEVTQHYAPSSENPAAPELFTRIDAEKSFVSYTLNSTPVSPNLSDLDQTLDAEQPGPFRINIVTGSVAPTDEQLLEGAIVAEGIALHRPSCSLVVSQSPALAAGVDNILVGTSAQLTSAVPAPVPTDASYLQIQTEQDPSHLNLIVGGTTDKGVTQAALALAKRDFPLPDSPEVAVSSTPSLVNPLILASGSYHHFSELGFKTSTAKGNDSFQLDFNLAPECLARSSNQVDLYLHFAYGTDLRRDSFASILVNGHPAATVPLAGENGGLFLSYRVALPIDSFTPGHNTLTVQPEMLPIVTEYCAPHSQDKQYVVLYDDSAILAPAGDHPKSVPDLRLFSRSGFPFVTSPTGQKIRFRIHLAKADSSTIGAAWTLLAKLAQKANRLVLPTEISAQLSHSPGPILAIGATGDLSNDLLAGSMVRLGGDGAMGGSRSGLGQIKGNIPPGQAPLLTSFYSPFDSKTLVILYTAGSPELLQTALAQLIQPQYWENLKGNTATWNDKPESLSTISY